MDGKVVSVESDQTAKQALDKMIQAKTWALIVERSGLPVGVVTEHDILRRCVAKGNNIDRVKVEEIMTSPLITVEPEMRAGEALEKILEKNLGRLYVVEGGKIIGRVTQTVLSANLLDVMISLANLKGSP
jgi:predicted transcriptional regulator